MERKKTIWSEHLVCDPIYHELPETSVYDFLLERTANYLNDPAIEFEGKCITYADLLRQIDLISKALLNLRIKQGDIVSIVSPNIPQAVAAVYAINRVGAVANMLHPLLSSSELQRHIEQTESRAVLILDMFFDKLRNIKWNIPEPEFVLFSVADALGFPKKLFVKKQKLHNKPENIHYWAQFLRGAKTITTPMFPAYDPNDTALILYSGGTTGESKGVCLSNRNINCYAIQCHEVGACVDKARSLAVMPIFHGFGLCSAIHNMLTCGSHLYLLPKYDVDQCNKLIFKKKIECIFAVPAIYEALIHSKQMQTKDYSFLKYMFCGGDGLKQTSEREFNSYMEKINSDTRIIPGYGLTECVAGCLSNALFLTKEGTAGMAFPDTELKIVVPGTEEEVPVDSIGELCVCGPTVMKGYYKNEAATKQALRKHADGKTWLHTGDAFSVDKDGFYTFHSRLNRMIVVNGFNVYPEQIEKALLQLPFIKKCCVVGEPTKIGGEKPTAVICLDKKQTTNISESEIREMIKRACKESVPEYALPQRIVFWDDLPVTKVNKIDFNLVKEKISGGKK